MRYNDEYDGLFKNSDKMKAFDELAELFYDRNFGTATKADVELLMFSIYMEALIAKNSDDEKVLNYDECSDYEMAKTLGITQARVRTLKEKKQQRYPVKFDWRKSIVKPLENATYNEKTGYIQMYIPDRNLYLEIQNYIEQQGGFVDIKLNSKLLSVRPEYFVALAIQAETEENSRKKIISDLRKTLKDNEDTELNLNTSSLTDFMKVIKSIDIKTVLSVVCGALSVGNSYISIINGISQIIR